VNSTGVAGAPLFSQTGQQHWCLVHCCPLGTSGSAALVGLFLLPSNVDSRDSTGVVPGVVPGVVSPGFPRGDSSTGVSGAHCCPLGIAALGFPHSGQH
jgi:hypothetical protein